MVQPAQGAGDYGAPAGGAGGAGGPYGSAPCESAPSAYGTLDAAAATAGRKRKAEPQDNERLSKRLSLLNLEQGGSKRCVPVETPAETPPGRRDAARDARRDDSPMQVDDSKHKVYIYNMDDELSSDSEPEDGQLVFLPDIDKRLRQNRIPPHVLASSDGELTGMQMVLYQDPRSLSVPEDKDGVRRAVIDARRRVRERQRLEREGAAHRQAAAQPDGDAMDMD